MKLIVNFFRSVILLSLVLSTFLLSGILLTANAQETPSQPTIDPNVTLYTAKNKHEISSVGAALDYRIIKRAGSWLLIRFKQPTVPVWVSEDYLARDGDRVIVNAFSLNARLQPSLTAPILMAISRGHASEVLSNRDGFVKIKAPSSLVVAIVDNAQTVLAPIAEAPKATKQEAPQASKWKTSTPTPSIEPKPVSSGDSKVTEAGPDVVRTTPTTTPTTTPAIKTAESVTSQQHILAPGDAISVLIVGEPELSISNARIPENGQVSFPLIDSVVVAGSTTRSIEEKLREKYAQGYLADPKLSVTIFSYRPIFIRGGVHNAGAFPYTEGLTIAKALALAGGAKKTAKLNGISVSRDGESVKTDLALDSQHLILSGDVITLTEEKKTTDESAKFIYVHGEVNITGEYSYRKGLTVEKAIVLAGGFSIRSSRRRVSVTRYIEGQEKPRKFKKVDLFFAIKPGDIINVGARLF